MKQWSDDVRQELLAPFTPEQVEFLPKGNANGKAQALAYIDARDVMIRLDDAAGPDGWEFHYDVVPGPKVMVQGRLTVLGVTRCDAGEADKEDEPLKSAVSDAIKRCAVHFGIGRYLYYLPRIWAPFDAQKRRFIDTPRLDPQAERRALSIVGYKATSQPSPGQDRSRQAVQRQERPFNAVSQPAPPPAPESRGDAAAQPKLGLELDGKRQRIKELLLDIETRGIDMAESKRAFAAHWAENPACDVVRADTIIANLEKALAADFDLRANEHH